MASTDIATLSEALAAQRDVSAGLPLSRAPSTAVSLAAVLGRAFTHAGLAQLPPVLEHAARIAIDLFWDASSARWQLCPQQLPATAPDPNQPPVDVQIGTLVCSSDRFGLQTILAAISAALDNQPALQISSTVSIVLNLHTLPSATPPSTTPAVSLSAQAAAFSRIVRPSDMASWRSQQPVSPYFSFSNRSFPSISFPATADLPKNQRIFLAFGTVAVDPLIYNVSADAATIFSSDDLGGVPAFTTDSINSASPLSCVSPVAGTSMAGTGFDLGLPQYSVPFSAIPQGTMPPAGGSSTNASRPLISWNFAYVSDTSTNPFTPQIVAKITACGFSPLFTQNYTSELINATIWSWAPGEPAPVSASSSSSASTISLFSSSNNCALVDLSKNDGSGKWVTESCQAHHAIACMDTSNPSSWSIVSSSSPLTYRQADAASVCPPSFAFAVPRSPLEQASLIAAMKSAGITSAWINLNRATPTCWVSDWGTPCPYTNTNGLLDNLIGANLKQGIFILTVLLLFVVYQIHSQWRASRESRRRAEVRRKIRQQEYKSIQKTARS